MAERHRELLLPHDPPCPHHGVVHSLVDQQAAINRYLAEHIADPKPFVWTATAESIIAELQQRNASLH